MEESPETLANPTATNAVNSTVPAQAGSEGVELGAPVEIVRATARLKLDFRTVRPVGRSNGDATGKELAAQLYMAQREVARAQNACITALWQDDSQRLMQYLADNNGVPPRTKKDWPEPDINLYKLARTVSPNIPGAMASVASRTAWQRWRQDRYASLVKLGGQPPYFGERCPIPLRAADVNVRREGDDYLIDFALRGGRGQRWLARVQPRDEYHKTVLGNIAAGTWKHGNILVERDRKGRWHFRIAYKRLVPLTQKGKIAAINRGIRVFLACVTEDDQRWLYDGNDIVAYLKQMQERRKQYQRDAKAAARSGRGRKRILRPIQHLSDKAGRWRATKCQTIARRLVRWLVDRGVKTLLVENFERIRDTDLDNEYVVQLVQEWPYYQLEQRIRSCCAEVGIEVVSLAPHYISQDCPRCGHREEKNRDLRYWRLKCVKCGYRNHLDAAAAKNLIQRERSGGDPNPGAKSQRKSVRKKGNRRTSRKSASNTSKSQRSGGKGQSGSARR